MITRICMYILYTMHIHTENGLNKFLFHFDASDPDFVREKDDELHKIGAKINKTPIDATASHSEPIKTLQLKFYFIRVRIWLATKALSFIELYEFHFFHVLRNLFNTMSCTCRHGLGACAHFLSFLFKRNSKLDKFVLNAV